MSPNLDETIDLRSKCPHFRVLIIGRANAGKTTLLKKVCNSIEDPEIFGSDGEKASPPLLMPQLSRDRLMFRGLHDIENQLIFKSNPQFIFHDSRGFESGSIEETEKVKTFIAKRAASSTLAKQLHAVWYCLPTDTNRPLLAADEQFFKTDVASKVPVIAIFTKFDGLITKAFTQLKAEGLDRKEAKQRQTERAHEMLSTDFIKRLMSTTFCPSEYVRMDDMRAKDNNCDELIGKTAKALSNDTLKLLFVSVQQNNIDLCSLFAVNS
ncbi:hypothetical protein C8R44DRAFT_611079 [Mycena epipterygia]|nr:hypothetical protein C8R44DRAFT_611079 [Mycena epipterygia]